MDISGGLIAKGALGAGALAAAGGAGYKYKDKIGEFISSLRAAPADAAATANDNAELNAKIKGLGIENCELGNGESEKTCELNSDALKKIAFSNKGDSDNTVTNLEIGKKISLKIEKGYGTEDFSSGLRFTFKSSNDNNVEIGSNSKIILKKDMGNDFKITTDGNKLESAWTLTSLAAKVGVTCSTTDATQCDFVTSKINVWKSGDDYITGASVEDNKKITVTKESTGYNGGFKLTVSEDITLTGGTPKSSGGVGKLIKENKAYEIDAKDKDGQKVWFLIEKSVQ